MTDQCPFVACRETAGNFAPRSSVVIRCGGEVVKGGYGGYCPTVGGGKAPENVRTICMAWK